MLEKQNGKHYVRWSIFIWAIGLVFLVISICFGMYYRTDLKLAKTTEQYATILQKLAGIQTNQAWIMRSIGPKK